MTGIVRRFAKPLQRMMMRKGYLPVMERGDCVAYQKRIWSA